jgi:hypothetical protein
VLKCGLEQSFGEHAVSVAGGDVELQRDGPVFEIEIAYRSTIICPS